MTTTSPPLDALILDMDGILVDVSKSYRSAIIQTVDLFFMAGLNLPADANPDPLLTNEDVEALKMAGGFNNDWDLTRAFVRYFLEMFPQMPMHTFPLSKRVPAILAFLQTVSAISPVDMASLRADKDIPHLARQVKMAGGGLNGIDKALTSRNRHLLFTGQGVLNGNLVKRIFQEVYLGSALFERTYGEKAVVVQQPGLINNETLMINPLVLAQLTEFVNLGIATGRPYIEAAFTLKRLAIDAYFDSLVTLDDVLEAEAAGKPDPWSLLEAARRIYPIPVRSAYVGDTPDDVRAARAANDIVPFVAIGVTAAARDKAALRRYFQEAGADMILEHPDQIINLVR